MSKKRAARAARQIVRDRAKLAGLVAGGSSDRPIAVDSSAVVEVRARAMPCALCDGEVRIGEHRADSGLRVVRVTCTRCHVARDLWFKLVSNDPN